MPVQELNLYLSFMCLTQSQGYVSCPLDTISTAYTAPNYTFKNLSLGIGSLRFSEADLCKIFPAQKVTVH